jgi:arginyl-tRNA synthetase
VVDLSQAEHFKMIFETARRGELLSPTTHPEHIGFGLVLGEDNKRFKSRSGEPVKLRDLLDESIRRCRKLILTRWSSSTASPDPFPLDGTQPLDMQREKVAQTLAIGSIKYADLSMRRESGYKFSYDRMLSLEGNTAPYMMYAYARIQGICRKMSSNGGLDIGALVEVEAPSLGGRKFFTDAERALALHLIRFDEVLSDVVQNSYLHHVGIYL